MTILPLTKRQREVYEFIAQYVKDHAYAPSLSEIGDALGLSSLATVSKHLNHLSYRGYIRRGWNQSRSITLLVGPGCCPTCGRELDEAKVPIESGRRSDTMGSVVDVGASTTPTTTEVP